MPFYPENLKAYKEHHSKIREERLAFIAEQKTILADMDKRKKKDHHALTEFIAHHEMEAERGLACVHDAMRAEAILPEFIAISEQIEALCNRKRALAASVQVSDSSLLCAVRQAGYVVSHRLGV